MESLSSYAKRFVAQVAKPDVDFIFGLSPVISIEQKTLSNNPRSTVGTMTDVASYLNLLFATIGQAHCPRTGEPAPTASQILEAILSLPGAEVELRAPVFPIYGEDVEVLYTELRKKGVIDARSIVGAIVAGATTRPSRRARPPTEMDAIVDRFIVGGAEKAIGRASRPRCSSGGHARRQGRERKPWRTGSTPTPAAPRIDSCTATSGPAYFQFNNPESACRTCGGLGVDKLTHPDLLVPDPDRSILGGCFVREAFKYNPDTWDGRLMFSLSTVLNFQLDSPWRLLSESARDAILYGTGTTKIPLVSPPDAKMLRGGPNGREVEVALRGKTIDDILNMSVEEGVGFFAAEPAIGRKIQVLVDLGLGYLTLGQSATTLSGGEAQRIKIATELSTLQRAKHTVYILDEPTTGLHLADIERLLGSLHKLVDAGHTVILIEHHLDVIKVADHVIDLGPDGGHAGGEVVATGTPEAIARCRTSHTGRFLKAHLAT